MIPPYAFFLDCYFTLRTVGVKSLHELQILNDRQQAFIEILQIKMLVRGMQILVRQAKAHHDGRSVQCAGQLLHDRDGPAILRKEGTRAVDMLERVRGFCGIGWDGSMLKANAFSFGLNVIFEPTGVWACKCASIASRTACGSWSATRRHVILAWASFE